MNAELRNKLLELSRNHDEAEAADNNALIDRLADERDDIAADIVELVQGDIGMLDDE